MSQASKSSNIKSRDSNIAEAAILDLNVDKNLGTGLLKPMMQCSEKGARFGDSKFTTTWKKFEV